jgi:hypothetical protein
MRSWVPMAMSSIQICMTVGLVSAMVKARMSSSPEWNGAALHGMKVYRLSKGLERAQPSGKRRPGRSGD